MDTYHNPVLEGLDFAALLQETPLHMVKFCRKLDLIAEGLRTRPSQSGVYALIHHWLGCEHCLHAGRRLEAHALFKTLGVQVCPATQAVVDELCTRGKVSTATWHRFCPPSTYPANYWHAHSCPVCGKAGRAVCQQATALLNKIEQHIRRGENFAQPVALLSAHAETCPICQQALAHTDAPVESLTQALLRHHQR